MFRRLISKDQKINNIVERIKIHFGFLFDHYGFEITDQLYDSRSFGNWIVLLRSNKLFIHIVKDREDLHLSLGPHLGFHQLQDSHHLLDLEILVDYINTKDFSIFPQKPSADMEEQLQKLGLLLKVNYDEIVAFIDNPKYSEAKENINKLRMEKIKAVYPYIQFTNEKE